MLGAPETALVITAVVLLAAGLARRASPNMTVTLALIGLLIAFGSVAILPARALAFGGMIVVTPLTSLFKAICILLAAFTVLLARRRSASPEYIAMIVLATVGLMLLVGAEELLVIFIGLELLGLSLYVLTAFDKQSLRSAEAGLKYFLFGSTASAFTLFGISLVYGTSGSTSLVQIAQNLASHPSTVLLAAGVVMTLVGFAFKIAAAPFHLWAPDTYEAAPMPSAAFIASASKVASFVVLGKIVLIGFRPLRGSADWHSMLAGWSPLLAVLAAASVLIGNFVALVQTNIRRLLAYSAVAHAGYTVIGFVAGGVSGFSAALFYTTSYSFTLIGAFGVCAIARQQAGGDNVQNFEGLAFRSPVAAGAMSVFLLSLAGLPPLAGFFGKFYLFTAAFGEGGSHRLLWLVAVALFGSLVSLYYYLVVLKVMFARGVAARTTPGAQTGGFETTVVAVLAAIVVLLGVAPTVLLSRIVTALQLS